MKHRLTTAEVATAIGPAMQDHLPGSAERKLALDAYEAALRAPRDDGMLIIRLFTERREFRDAARPRLYSLEDA